MKHIVINNLGPIKHADIVLAKYNIVVGAQSSGKSCLLKVASFCSWVEKRILLSQDHKPFLNLDSLDENLWQYHKLMEYVRQDTYFKYESDAILFSYNNQTKRFYFRWKDRWNYHCPQLSYIPAERNLIAVIPNWYDVKFDQNNIRGFMSEWEESRKVVKEAEILNLNVRYHYNESQNSDSVLLPTGEYVMLTNTSSGLQSLTPICVHIDWLYRQRLLKPRKTSMVRQQIDESLANALYTATVGEENERVASLTIGNSLFWFSSKKKKDAFQQHLDVFLQQHHTELFLEEPELNLFPPTQVALVEKLIEYNAEKEESSLFLATHSPYIVTAFLEKDRKDLALFVINQDNEGMSVIRGASQNELQEMYDYGVDVFFNIESFK